MKVGRIRNRMKEIPQNFKTIRKRRNLDRLYNCNFNFERQIEVLAGTRNFKKRSDECSRSGIRISKRNGSCNPTSSLCGPSAPARLEHDSDDRVRPPVLPLSTLLPCEIRSTNRITLPLDRFSATDLGCLPVCRSFCDYNAHQC
jgi:hypothetical protein